MCIGPIGKMLAYVPKMTYKGSNHSLEGTLGAHRMTRNILILLLGFLVLTGCANQDHTQEKGFAEDHGCADYRPDFERFLENKAKRKEIEEFIQTSGGQFERLTTEHQLQKYKYLAISAKNMAIFRRYHNAMWAGLECDNQFIIFFDDGDLIVTF